MYVIAGATGRVGSRAARHLLSRGERVRVLVRREADARRWEGAGAEARVLALTDTASLADALESSRGFFALLPFDLTAADLDAHADSLVSSIAGAVAKARVPYVVMLSSGGADLPAGTGPIVGLHRLEQALLATGTTLTALRSAHFQEKVSDVLDVALGTGVYPVFSASADVPRAMTATSDLGRLVAEALLAPASRSEAVDVLGPAATEREVAAALGEAIGCLLEVVVVPEEAWAGTLVEAGLPPHVAEQLAELYRADDAGLRDPRGARVERVTTPLTETLTRLLAATGEPR